MEDAGDMGYHQRVDFNKKVLKIGEKADEVNPAGGFKRYGLVKNSYLILKGSIQGPSKRIIRFTLAKRPKKKLQKAEFQVQKIKVTSPQGR